MAITPGEVSADLKTKSQQKISSNERRIDSVLKQGLKHTVVIDLDETEMKSLADLYTIKGWKVDYVWTVNQFDGNFWDITFST